MAVRVLVVDDEQDFLDSIVMRLELRSIEVDGVGTGVAALELLDAKPFDVVVLTSRCPAWTASRSCARSVASTPASR
jgi:DNA-binding response OmpR family regulator